MAPLTKREFLVVELNYFPQLNPQYPVYLTRKRRRIDGFMPFIQHWINRTMQKEISHTPENLKVRYCQWRVMTGDENIFTVGPYHFNNALLILAEDTMHWLFYQTMPLQRRLAGRCPLTDNFCTCCFHKQYIKVLQTIKNCFNSNNHSSRNIGHS